MKEFDVRIIDQSGQSARITFRLPLVGQTTWQILDAGKLSATGGTVEMIHPRAYAAHQLELDAKEKAWRAGEIVKADGAPMAPPFIPGMAPLGLPPIPGALPPGAPGAPGAAPGNTRKEPLAHLAARIVPPPPMTMAPPPDWMHALLKVDDCLWNSASHMKSSHPNYGVAIGLSAFLHKQLMEGVTRTGAGILYHKYARGLRPGLIKWELERAPCRVQLADQFQNWPGGNTLKQAVRITADLPGSQLFH